MREVWTVFFYSRELYQIRVCSKSCKVKPIIVEHEYLSTYNWSCVCIRYAFDGLVATLGHSICDRYLTPLPRSAIKRYAIGRERNVLFVIRPGVVPELEYVCPRCVPKRRAIPDGIIYRSLKVVYRASRELRAGPLSNTESLQRRVSVHIINPRSLICVGHLCNVQVFNTPVYLDIVVYCLLHLSVINHHLGMVFVFNTKYVVAILVERT